MIYVTEGGSPVEEICRETGASIAVYNHEGMTVISGSTAEITLFQREAASGRLRREGRKLPISGAFHSRHMEEAKNEFIKELDATNFATPLRPVVMNVNGKPETDPGRIQENLASNFTSPVRWMQSVQFMRQEGVRGFYIFSPTDFMNKIITKIDKDAPVHSVTNLASAQAETFEEVYARAA